MMKPDPCSRLLLLLSLLLPLMAAAADTSLRTLDRIVVVVNDDVITRHELDSRLASVVALLKKQGTQLPEAAILEKQVLERMITEMLQQQHAKEIGLRIDEAQLEKTLSRIAQQNGFATLAEFRIRLEQDGIDFRKFREEIRNEMLLVRLREREVESKLVIGENEIDNFLATQAKLGGKDEELLLAHILVLVPEQASAEKIQNYQRRAQEALNRLRAGASFAQIAAGYSDANDAMQGGVLGWRAANRLPALFAEPLARMQPGEVSEVLRSPSGFHIIKLLDRRSNDTPVLITQTHARHILIKTSEIMPEHEARAKLEDIRKRIVQGEDFAELAKRYSEDASAAAGGDLGWLSPGETVTEFEKTMNALKEGQISEPVQTGFGWHLIQVLERRNADVTAEQKRRQAREAIRAFRAEDAYQDWLRQLRDRAFIEYRE